MKSGKSCIDRIVAIEQPKATTPKLEKIFDNVHDVVDPHGIEPPHGVRDVAKKDKLVRSMEKNGWVGRPILVFDAGRGNEALTGSHRIAAAKQSGIEIPIYKIDENIGNYADENGNTIFDASYFEEENIVKFLKEFGDKGAAKLMEQEIKANINNKQLQALTIKMVTEFFPHAKGLV